MKVMPVSYPPITSYENIAAVMMILWSRKEKTIPWFLDHFIQLYASNEPFVQGTFYDMANNDNFHPEGGCPFLLKYSMNRDMIEQILFSDFIEHQIDNDYYLNVTLDQYELSCSRYFKKEHKYHITFIYGYDKNHELIYIADFYNGNKLSYETITYDELNRGYSSINKDNAKEWETEIFLFKFNETSYNTNISLLNRYLSDYLYGIDSFSKYVFSFRHQRVTIRYGIDYYKMLMEHCEEKRERRSLDIRRFHVLYDHKVLMRLRVEHLILENYINSNDTSSFIFTINDLERRTLLLRNLAIKYNITYSDYVLCRIVSTILELEVVDRNMVAKLLAYMGHQQFSRES